jgi:hypothetical protein
LPCAEETWRTAKAKWAPTGPYSWQPGPYSWQPWIFDPKVQICARHLYKNNNPKSLDPCLSSPPTPAQPSVRRRPFSLPHIAAPPLPPSSRRRPFSTELQPRRAMASHGGAAGLGKRRRPRRSGRPRQAVADLGRAASLNEHCRPRSGVWRPDPACGGWIWCVAAGTVALSPAPQLLLLPPKARWISWHATPHPLPCRRRMAAGAVTSSPRTLPPRPPL